MDLFYIVPSLMIMAVALHVCQGQGPGALYGAPPKGKAPAPGYPSPPGAPQKTLTPPKHPGGGGGGGEEEGGSSEPEPFKFEYEVKDAATNTDFSHKQESDGKKVTGEYKVLLPDGRNQIVSYMADEGGFNADVKYEGEAAPGPSGPGGGAPAPGGAPAGGGYPSGGPKPPPGGGGYPKGGPQEPSYLPPTF